jgi:Secretory lipase
MIKNKMGDTTAELQPRERICPAEVPDGGPWPVSRRSLLAGFGAISSATLATRAFAGAPPAPAFRLEDGVLVSAQRLDTETGTAFRLFNTSSVLPDFNAVTHGARHDIILHRIVTTTTVPETGESLEVTGLLALPAGATGELPVVSWQHGTILSFDQVPSNLTKLSGSAYQLSDAVDSLETLFNLQRFAANGFAVIAADYVGKGPLRNGRGEGYAVKGVTVRTCIDVLNAGLAALSNLGVKPTTLFLHGWSQGALNTQWLHQALRADGVQIEATAVASPFNDLSEAWRFWAGRQTFPLPAGVDSYPNLPSWISLCMIVALGSYELHYDLKGLIESAVKPEYGEMARQYWKTYDISKINVQPFPSGSDLLVRGFFDGYTDDRNSAFLRQFAANGASYWNYDREIRFHYGRADEAIHPEMVARALSAGGKYAHGVPVSRANPRTTFLAGLYGDEATLAGHDNVLSWFTRKL